ncbi:MAG TPA: NAD(P)/FAD-dependent oxidoreductase [Candidatus Binatia bacterium]|nr:NAD(P)/FAD-dependent oxidoreductase [Candidatus Binatia bacterium]
MDGSASAFEAPKPWGRHPRPGPWDAIVIGSGIGGMVAAALLAKLGKRVLILEQHYVPGGFTHTFARRGYRWDVGVHAVGEMTERGVPGRMMSALTDGRLEWASLGPVYDSFQMPDGLRVDYPDNPRQFRENLLQAFPREKEAIDGYLRLAREASADLRAFYVSRALPRTLGAVVDRTFGRKARRHQETTVAEVISRLTADPRLRTMFASQWGYYGSTPSRASFSIQASVVTHFLWGGYYPVGGSERIARELLRTVAEAGGWTRIRADVRETLVEGGKAAGVRMADGEEIRAPLVISAIGAIPTVTKLLPEHVRRASWTSEISRLRPGPAHVCLYLGFKGDVRAAGAGANNQWFYETWDPEDDAWHVAADTPAGSAPVLYVSFPSLKDPSHDPGPERRHTGEAVTFVPWDRFLPWREKRWMRRGEEYAGFKARLQEAMLEQLFRHLPGLRPMLDYAELSTPVSTDHFTRAAGGSIYGLESTPERFRCQWLRPRTPVPGLLMAGVDVGGPGVMGGAMGGILAGISAEPWDAMGWLRRHVF